MRSSTWAAGTLSAVLAMTDLFGSVARADDSAANHWPSTAEESGDLGEVAVLTTLPAQTVQRRTSGSGVLSFIEELHQVHLSEIEHAQMAQQRAASASVRALARQITRDHARADRAALAYLSRIGRVPSEASAPDTREWTDTERRMERLHGIVGPAFDKDYVALIIESRARLVATIGDLLSRAHDPQTINLLAPLPALLMKHARAARGVRLRRH